MADASLTHSTDQPPPAQSGLAPRPPGIRVDHGKPDAPPPTREELLAAVHFGARAADGVSAPLQIRVDLAPLERSPSVEYWYANGPAHAGVSGRVRFARDDHFQFAVLEQDERSLGGVRAAAESVYSEIQRFQRESPFPHLLRMWNYLDAINEGAGDRERYREFCIGRADGLIGASTEGYPAATAIGTQRTTGILQVFWLSGRVPGAAVENPRQVSAYRYPRTHGPVSPSFSRATRAPDGTVLISGTASIVGHLSHHHDDAMAQLEETLRNLEALTANADPTQNAARPELMKVYVRHPAHAPSVARRLRERFPNSEPLFLAADICRSELLLEIEGIQRP